jgi:hypothetical protein
MNGIDLIIAERVRQISAEGFSHVHDDEHDEGELIRAAITYAGTPSELSPTTRFQVQTRQTCGLGGIHGGSPPMFLLGTWLRRAH